MNVWQIVSAVLGTALTLPFFMLITTFVYSAVTRRSLDTIDVEVFRTPLFWVLFLPTTIVIWVWAFSMSN